jgi:integrase
MTALKLLYVKKYQDRHGMLRHYFRRPGFPSATLPGLPGSREFMVAYQVALSAAKAPRKGPAVAAGTFHALLMAYYGSSEFRGLKATTQANYRNILERFRTKHGDKTVANLRREHVKAMLDERAATPGAGRNFLKRLSVVLDYAVDAGWRDDNPARSVKRPRQTGEGFAAWSEADIAAFEAKWPEGSRARLALALLLFTGQRRSDVVTMGWQHVRDKAVYVVQIKTGARLTIPVHPELQAVLDALPKTNLTFLMTEYGKPMTAAGFSGWFVGCAKAAGLIDRTPHGLRKAAGRRLAEAGCSAHQIMSILGHKSLSEAERYTRSVDQERMAKDAIASLPGAKREQ